MGCFLDDLRAFRINADQWTTEAQDNGKRRTAEQGAKRFTAKCIAAEKVRAGLRHAVVCSNVMGKTKKRIAQSKRVRAGSLAISCPATSGANLYLRAFGLQMSCGPSLMLCLFVLLRSRLYAFTEATVLRSIVLQYAPIVGVGKRGAY